MIDIAVRCVFTNTTPTAPYRGAGRPEANYRPRARGRRGRARHRHRSDQAAAAQPDHAVGDAVQDRRRHHLSTAAISRPCSTRRWRSPTTTASSSAGAKPPSAASTAASAFPACWSMPAARRSKATALSFPGGEHLVLGLNVQSTGQGHATIFPAWSPSGSASSRSRSTTGTATPRMEIAGYASVGSRSAMTVGHAHGQDRRGDAREGQDDRRHRARSRRSRHRISRRRFDVVGTDRRIAAVRSRRARQGDEEARRDPRRPRHQGHRRDAADLSQRLPHRRGRDRSRDRRR